MNNFYPRYKKQNVKYLTQELTQYPDSPKDTFSKEMMNNKTNIKRKKELFMVCFKKQNLETTILISCHKKE